MVVRQAEPSRAQNTPTQRQVYTIDVEAPTTPAKQRGTIVETSATPQTGAQLLISDGTAIVRDPTITATGKILAWSRLAFKQFTEWCQANQVNQMSTQEQWSLIAQCFPQETLDVMETIVGGRRSEEGLPRQEFKKLTLDEAMRFLKASALDVGSNYNKVIMLAGNLLRQTRHGFHSQERRRSSDKRNHERFPRRHCEKIG